MREAGQQMPESKPTLEINPQHDLLKRVDAETDDGKATDLATLLLEQAEIAAGAPLPDPAAFVQRMNRADQRHPPGDSFIRTRRPPAGFFWPRWIAVP